MKHRLVQDQPQPQTGPYPEQLLGIEGFVIYHANGCFVPGCELADPEQRWRDAYRDGQIETLRPGHWRRKESKPC